MKTVTVVDVTESIERLAVDSRETFDIQRIVQQKLQSRCLGIRFSSLIRGVFPLYNHICPEKPVIQLPVSSKDENYATASSNTLPFNQNNEAAAYRWPISFVQDLLAALTIAFIHIPHGLAQGTITGLGPIFGLYAAVLPPVVYGLFTTSRHNAIGGSTAVSVLVGNAVRTANRDYRAHSVDGIVRTNITLSGQIPDIDNFVWSYVTTLTFLVGMFHIAFWIFRLGTLSALLMSDTFTSAFIFGASLKLVLRQLPTIIGVKNLDQNAYQHFRIAQMLRDLFRKIPEITNWTEFSVFLFAMFSLWSSRSMLRRLVRLGTNKKGQEPELSSTYGKIIQLVPVEVVLIVTAIGTSVIFQLPEQFGLETVGEIPRGLPPWRQPTWSRVPKIWLDALSIALMSHVLTISLGKYYASVSSTALQNKASQQQYYSSNRELVALGLANMTSSLTSSFAVSASVTRTSVQVAVGGQSQLVSIFSSVVLAGAVACLGQYLQHLPKTVLSAIVIYSQYEIVVQLQNLRHLSILDTCVWILTCFIVVAVDVNIGLVVGLIVSCISVLFQTYGDSWKPAKTAAIAT